MMYTYMSCCYCFMSVSALTGKPVCVEAVVCVHRCICVHLRQAEFIPIFPWYCGFLLLICHDMDARCILSHIVKLSMVCGLLKNIFIKNV